ncbi:hypothetical protein EXIGLDRAFT_712983 [Exidia glandulosa HHB12029]|uniref:Uncharacterized protein n=1 Tax=Exidia glandulosa HHB12029 TaxID=1314781 RepID=A0A165LXG1_EXIGL|nr:hypothetical protein EXIGLDRAFT_712983 [Exidia glandulosa HHB12029]
MIFAGDFAQLPPVHGHSLYAHSVGVAHNAGASHNKQNAAIGKALWHQVNKVVILRQNMRQTAQSEADSRLRQALMNMRYKACTKDDCDFLDTLVARRPEVIKKLSDTQFRHVSIITGINSHRDELNAQGTLKFSRDTQQPLHTFYSRDSIDTNRGENRVKGKRHKYVWTRHISAGLRNQLWDNVPGTLQLCKGMPVIIKKNLATECGVTNGAEGTVVDWIATPLPDNKYALDVVFIQLFRNKTMQIPGLPKGIVPIYAVKEVIDCHLLDDTIMTIQREQVQMLPNFGMTDYNSQGKTRLENVVDLNNMKTHQAYYTALSRSASADGTIILQGFDRRKIVGGASRELRTEFQDLELLAEMTRLEFQHQLSPGVNGTFRYARIAQFLLFHSPDEEKAPHRYYSIKREEHIK